MIIPDIITLLDSHGFDYRGPNFLKVYPRPAFEFLTHNVLANAVHFYLLPYNGVTIWLNNSTTTSMIRTPGRFNSNLELLTSTTADLSAISQRLKLLQLQFMGMTAVNFSSAAVDNVTLLLVKVRTVINSSSSSGGTGGGGSNSGSSPALSAVNLKSIRQTRNLTKTSWKILSTLADICQYGQESPVSPTTYPFAFVFTSGAISTSVPTSSHPPPPPLTPTHTHTHTPPPSPPPTQQNSLDSTIAGQQQIIDFRSDHQLVMQRLVNQTDYIVVPDSYINNPFHFDVITPYLKRLHPLLQIYDCYISGEVDIDQTVAQIVTWCNSCYAEVMFIDVDLYYAVRDKLKSIANQLQLTVSDDTSTYFDFVVHHQQ